MFIKEMDSWCPECGSECIAVVEHIKYKVPIRYHHQATEYQYEGGEPEEITTMMPYVTSVAANKQSVMVMVMCDNDHQWSAECYTEPEAKERQKDLLIGATDAIGTEDLTPDTGGVTLDIATDCDPDLYRYLT